MSTPPPKNIIISHVYSSDNKGDAALTAVLINDLKRRFPEATLSILKLDGASGNGQFEGVPETPAFMSYALNKYKHPLAKLAYVLFMIPATLLWAWLFRATGTRLPLPKELQAIADIYVAADLVVAVGGGYIRSREGLMNRFNVPLLLHPLLFGYILRKPTVLYPQSVGPFVNASERPLVAFVLRRMAVIILREDTSVALLAGMGVTRNVVRSVDSGFLLRSNSTVNVRQRYHIAPDALIVGVTVRAWLKDDAQKAYEQAVAAALDNLVENFNAHILFIPQVTAAKGDDDRVTSHHVHDYMQHAAAATTIDDKLNHYQIKAVYDGLDILLGTRFHSVIFSLTSYVPVFAIEYEHKTSGIMHDLGLDQWAMKIEDVTAPRLTEALHQLLQHKRQYKWQLRKRLPSYLHKARQTILMAEDSYYAAQ